MSRNRKPLTLGEKLRIIEEAEKRNGATKASIARDLNIPESSLKTILAKKDSILLNAANQLQPLDAGVVKCMKQKYRKFLVQRRLAGMERKQLDKKLSVLDAMHYIASAWDTVTPETIANSFRHCGFNRSDDCSTSEAALPVDDEPEFGSLELPGSFADYVGADDDVAVCSEVSLDDIIETVRPDTAGTSDEEEMDDAAEASVSVPTYADVLCYVDHIRRRRKLKAKAKLTGSTNSGPSNLPSHMKADPPGLSTRLEMQQKSEEDDPTKAGAASNRCSNDGSVPTAENAVSERRAAESIPHSTKPMDENELEDIAKNSTSDASSFNFEVNLITSEQAESDALTDSDAADIARLLRKALKKNGPSLEEDLLSALSPPQVQYVIHAYGTLTAFMDHRPEFKLAREGQYIFVYYEDVDCEECDWSGQPDTQDEPNSGRYSSGANDGGSQHSDDGEPEREQCSSSSSSCYETAAEEQYEEDEKHELKDASCQVPLSSCHSRGLQTEQETSDADAQTKELDTSRFVELQSTLQSRDAYVTQLKERLEDVRQNQVSEVQQLRLKTEQLLTSPQAPTPHHVVSLRNRTAKREKQPVDNRAHEEVHPPLPRPPLRQRNLPPRLRPESKLMTHPVETKPQPVTHADKLYSSETPLPAQAAHELPGWKKSANACTDVVSTVSCQGKTTRSSTEKQISQIVRMVKKKQPDHTEIEIRETIRHLRLTKGGLTGMTFSAIVDLLLGQLKAGAEDKD
ncbi:hypothetical protein HPB52_001267 [Rhipicephalus sanguineus]|uniref:Uncharacterized protein n=1 Tax=Rhipicephalus sanguineus TaxID=34632 RepID=A0A9D4QFF4_RHISA|nr:hypothetical protein HPB52_001267 [Rhipicephalus sanguineus]